MVRRRALEKIGGYEVASNSTGEDTDMARRLRAVGRVKFDLPTADVFIGAAPKKRRRDNDGVALWHQISIFG